MITISFIDLLDFNNILTFPLTTSMTWKFLQHHRGEGVAMIPATDVVDDGSLPVGTCHCHPGRVTLLSAKRAAGGGLPLFFLGRNSGDAKPGWDGFVFSTACAMKTGEVTIFCVAQGLWSFVCCLLFQEHGCFAKVLVTIIRSHSVFGSGTVGYWDVKKCCNLQISCLGLSYGEDHHNRATTATTGHHGLGGGFEQKRS